MQSVERKPGRFDEQERLCKAHGTPTTSATAAGVVFGKNEIGCGSIGAVTSTQARSKSKSKNTHLQAVYSQQLVNEHRVGVADDDLLDVARRCKRPDHLRRARQEAPLLFCC